MPYCTKDDILLLLPEQELIQLVDDANSGTIETAGEARINAAIEYTSAQIDSFARRGGAAIPLEDTALAKGLNVQLAICLLIKVSRNVIANAREQMCKEAVALLESLANREASPADSATDSLSEVREGTRVFTRESMKNL